MELKEEEFLKKYNIRDTYIQSGLSWEFLSKIATDYESKIDEFRKIAVCYVDLINTFPQVHSVRFRLKDVEHLIEKIIRKAAEYKITNTVYDVNTYLIEITDIIGIRALYVFKSDYLPLHNKIINSFKRNFCEKPQIKLKVGDNENIYKGLKDVEVQRNASYRSIHYTIRHRIGDEFSVPIELQTRSIFEEGWSEINHKILYKKNDLDFDKKLLLEQATSILSSIAGECDAIGELMKNIANYEEQYDFVKDDSYMSGEEIVERIIKIKN